MEKVVINDLLVLEHEQVVQSPNTITQEAKTSPRSN